MTPETSLLGTSKPPLDPNALEPIVCDHPGCSFVAKNALSLKMHQRRTHVPESKKWNSNSASSAKTKKKKARLLALETTYRPVKERKERKSEAQGLVVNFCPSCGCHLRGVALALNFKQ